MQLSKGATVAVVDGEKFNLFRNAGDEAGLKLVAVPHDAVDHDHNGSIAGRHGSSANHDNGQDQEDGFSTGVAAILNRKVLDGKIAHLLVIAAPRTLGALRQHYHEKLSAILVGEIAKDLTGHDVHAVQKAVGAA
jgi:protein required for attachment to host cells